MKRLFTLTAIAASLSTSHVHAQNDSGALEEVFVTAQKREQTLAEVPISVSVFSSAFFEDSGVDNFTDLSRFTPNFNFYEGYLSTQVVFNMRGLTSGTEIGGIDPAIGFFLDGVYLARPGAMLGKLVDIERVEVLRGPQGTLYGRNTSVGAVNIVTRDPGEAFRGQLQAGFANYDTVDMRYAASGPLSDGLRASLSGFYVDGDMKIDNPVTGGKPMGEDRQHGARMKLIYDVSDTLRLRLNADYTRVDIGGSMFAGLYARENFLDPASRYRLDPYYQAAHTPGVERNDTDMQGVAGIVEWDTALGAFKSTSAWRNTEITGLADASVVEENLAVAGALSDTGQFSQEFQLASTLEDSRFSYIVGLYYFDSDFELTTPTTFPLFAQTLGLPPQSTGHNIVIETESSAVFGQLSYDLSDALSVTYGYRYTEETKSADIVQDPDIMLLEGSPLPFPIQFPRFVDRQSFSDTNFTNMLSFNYQLTPASNLYFTYSEGVKSGGYNSSIVSDPELTFQFDPEESINYEIGYRGAPTDTLTFSVAAYYSDFENLQVQAFSPVNPSVIVVTNAGSAETKGIESDLKWTPIPGLTATATLAYNEAEYTDTELLVDTNNPEPVDFSGRPLGRAPEWTGSLGLQYDWQLSAGLNVRVRADYTYTGAQYLDALLDERSFQEGYELLDLRASISTADDRWRFSIWGRNVLGEEYITQALPNPAGPFKLFFPDLDIPSYVGAVGNPRTYGVEIVRRFGE
jgi:iron complex outermembrane receptor protein